MGRGMKGEWAEAGGDGFGAAQEVGAIKLGLY